MELDGIIVLSLVFCTVVIIWSVLRLLVYYLDTFGNGRTRNVLARLRQKRCFRCGYDMRSSAWRCPECGWQRGGTPEQVAALRRMSEAQVAAPEDAVDFTSPDKVG